MILDSSFWDTGDVVIATATVTGQFTKGKEYTIDYVNWQDEVIVAEDDSGNSNGWHVDNFIYKRK